MKPGNMNGSLKRFIPLILMLMTVIIFILITLLLKGIFNVVNEFNDGIGIVEYKHFNRTIEETVSKITINEKLISSNLVTDDKSIVIKSKYSIDKEIKNDKKEFNDTLKYLDKSIRNPKGYDNKEYGLKKDSVANITHKIGMRDKSRYLDKNILNLEEEFSPEDFTTQELKIIREVVQYWEEKYNTLYYINYNISENHKKSLQVEKERIKFYYDWIVSIESFMLKETDFIKDSLRLEMELLTDLQEYLRNPIKYKYEIFINYRPV